MSASACSVLALAIAGLLGAAVPSAQAAAAAGPPAPQTAPQGVSVSPVTVRPQTESKGQVVASTAAAPLTSPDFTAEDARDPPLAVGLGPNAAFGRQKPEISAPAGLLKTNPDLPGGYRTVDVGVTAVF